MEAIGVVVRFNSNRVIRLPGAPVTAQALISGKDVTGLVTLPKVSHMELRSLKGSLILQFTHSSGAVQERDVGGGSQQLDFYENVDGESYGCRFSFPAVNFPIDSYYGEEFKWRYFLELEAVFFRGITRITMSDIYEFTAFNISKGTMFAPRVGNVDEMSLTASIKHIEDDDEVVKFEITAELDHVLFGIGDNVTLSFSGFLSGHNLRVEGVRVTVKENVRFNAEMHSYVVASETLSPDHFGLPVFYLNKNAPDIEFENVEFRLRLSPNAVNRDCLFGNFSISHDIHIDVSGRSFVPVDPMHYLMSADEVEDEVEDDEDNSDWEEGQYHPDQYEYELSEYVLVCVDRFGF